jgi:uncharacterized protein YbjT (DUF2867 family)
MSTTLVTGVSGHTGSVVAQTLLEQKQKVRVLVRDAAKGERWKKRGAEVSVGSVDDAHAMAAALRGVDAAYLLVPPPPPSFTGFFQRAQKITDAFVQTLSGSHAKHVVFLSSVGAQWPDKTGVVRALHQAEKALSTLKVPCTFLRACYFMENWGSVLPAAKDGQLPTFLPADAKFPQVATHDIGLLAAALLSDHPKAHRVVELAGPVDVSPKDVAATLGKLLGREVQVVSQPVAQVAASFQQFGFSAEIAGLYQEMMEGILAGRLSFEHPETLRRGKQTLEQTLGEMLKHS